MKSRMCAMRPRWRSRLRAAKPDFVFHLAAQPLVRLSYEQPQETYATNVMGTVHVLEALRKLDRPCHAVFITTDKCYENLESGHAYREEDPLGGYDPYSSSKAAAEIVIAAYRNSFFPPNESSISIASARAGNVIGGGDWAADRIVPDSIRALQRGEPIPVRNKTFDAPVAACARTARRLSDSGRGAGRQRWSAARRASFRI